MVIIEAVEKNVNVIEAVSIKKGMTEVFVLKVIIEAVKIPIYV